MWEKVEGEGREKVRKEGCEKVGEEGKVRGRAGGGAVALKIYRKKVDCNSRHMLP